MYWLLIVGVNCTSPNHSYFILTNVNRYARLLLGRLLLS